MAELEQGGIDIVLPDNPELRKELNELLVQQQEELKKFRAEHKYTAPENFVSHNATIMVIEELLREGKLNTWNFSRKYEAKWGLITNALPAAVMAVHRKVDPDFFKQHPELG